MPSSAPTSPAPPPFPGAPDAPSGRWWLGLTAAVTTITLRAFAPALSRGFTDADDWADVAYARHPLADQLLARLTGGVAGDDANFWRPAVMIQLWIERRLFGWEPTGWHAWNLGLHVVASLLVAALVLAQARFVGSRGRALAASTSLLFAAHPLTEEVVPVVARSIDLLLGVGTFAALGALVAWQARRRAGRPGGVAWAGMVVATLLALGSKELAVLLAPLVGLWVLLHRIDLPARARLREAVLAAAGPALLTLAYLAVRNHVLGGLGGYGGTLTWSWIRSAYERLPIEPFVPSGAAWFASLRGWPSLLLLGPLWALTLTAAWRSPHRGGAILGLAWLLAATALFGVTGTASRRVLYVPTLAGLLIVVPALLHAWTHRRTLGGKVGLGLGVGWLATFLHGTPALVRYPDWQEIARANDAWLVGDVWASLPAGTDVWLVDRPFRGDIDPRRYRYWGGRGMGFAHGATAYSLEALLDERLPALDLDASTLTGWALLRPVAEQSVTITADGAALVVHHTGGVRQDWDIRSPFTVTTDAGALRITPARRAMRRTVLAVWTPAGPEIWRPVDDGWRREAAPAIP